MLVRELEPLEENDHPRRVVSLGGTEVETAHSPVGFDETLTDFQRGRGGLHVASASEGELLYVLFLLDGDSELGFCLLHLGESLREGRVNVRRDLLGSLRCFVDLDGKRLQQFRGRMNLRHCVACHQDEGE